MKSEGRFRKFKLNTYWMKRGISIIGMLMLIVPMIWAQGGNRPAPPGKGGNNMPERKIIGLVYDETGQPVPYASVVAFAKRDSALVGGTATDEEGRFILSIRPGVFTIVISYLSYNDHIFNDVNAIHADVYLPPAQLSQNENLLNEVVVEGERTEMELKLDKRVYNIGTDLSSLGSNAADLLDNLPSVEVDVEGNVSLRGSENVRILIDGKPSGLTGLRTQDALRQLQGDMIEKVEVITNPSARYDAEGEVGIINIILKKQKKSGLNGSLTVRAGLPETIGASANLNFNTGKVNYFATYSIDHRKSPGFGKTYQVFTEADTSFSFDSEREHIRGGLSHMVMLGTDIKINQYNSLTLSGSINLADNTNIATMLYHDFNSNEELVQTVEREEVEDELSNSYQLNFYHQKTFKKKGKSLVTQAQWDSRRETELADVLEESSNSWILPLKQRVDNKDADDRFLFQSDFILPFGENAESGKFEAGVKATLRTLDSDYLAEEQDSASNWFELANYSNHMIYKENIYAAYIMIGNKHHRLSYQAGLRAEYADVSTELLETEEYNRRKYLRLFPSAHFSYELNESRFLQLSYSRRLRRPHFWHLIPFYGLSDTRNFASGNPDLDPENTHSFELGYLNQWKSGSLLSSIYYRYSTDVFQRIVESDSLGFLHGFPVNAGNTNSFGVEISGSWQIVKSLSFSGSFNFYRSIGAGSYNGQDLGFDTYSWSARSSLRWNLTRIFSAQSSFRYRGPEETGQGERLASYNLDMGASLDVFSGNGTLTLSARDILNSRKRRSITFGEGFYQESEFQWRSRMVVLSFNYRLNQKKSRSNGMRDGGYDEGDMGM